MKLTRRDFIFGTAAALALASLPVELRPGAGEVAKRIPVFQPFLNTAPGLKRICGLTFFCHHKKPMTVELRAGNRETFLRFTVAPYQVLDWRPAPECELIVLPNETFRVSADPCDGDASVYIGYLTEDGRMICEQFNFGAQNADA